MIYVLGQSALSFYLMSRLQDSDQPACLISNKIDLNKKYSVNIKEDGRLNKKQYDIPTQIHLNKAIDLLIVAAPLSEIKTELTTLSKSKLKDAKILCLSGLDDTELFANFFEKDAALGYVDGFLMKKNDNVTILGKSPKIMVSKNCAPEFLDVFAKAKISLEAKDNHLVNFWQYFAAHAISYLASLAYKKSMFDVLKNKESRALVEELGSDMAKIVQKNIQQGTSGEILSQIYSIPNNFIYDFSLAELNFIDAIISKNTSQQNAFNKLTKIIYNHNTL